MRNLFLLSTPQYGGAHGPTRSIPLQNERGERLSCCTRSKLLWRARAYGVVNDTPASPADPIAISSVWWLCIVRKHILLVYPNPLLVSVRFSASPHASIVSS